MHLEKEEPKMSEKWSYKSNLFAFGLSWVLWLPITNATGVYFQIFLTELGANPSVVGIVLSVASFIIGFSRILGGYIADFYGRKKIIVILTYVASFVYLAYAFAETWVHILIASIVMNITLLYQPAIRAILADSIPEERRALSFGVIMNLPTVISIFSPYLALWAISTFGILGGMRILYLISFITGIIAGTIRLLLLRETLRSKGSNQQENEIELFKKSYSEALVFLKKNLIPLSLIYLLINLSMGIGTLTQIYAIQYLGISAENWGWFVLYGTVVFLILTFPFGYLTDKIGRKIPISISMVLNVIALYLWYSTPMNNAEVFILSAILIGNAAAAFVTGAFPALEADVVPQELRGRITALLRLVASVSLATGQLLSGFIYEIFTPRFPFLISLIIRSLGLIPIIFLKEKIS